MIWKCRFRKYTRQIPLTIRCNARIQSKNSVCISLSTKAFLKRWRSAQIRGVAAHEQTGESRTQPTLGQRYFAVVFIQACLNCLLTCLTRRTQRSLWRMELCSDLDNILLHPMELNVLYMFIFIITGKFPNRLNFCNGCGWVSISFLRKHRCCKCILLKCNLSWWYKCLIFF